MNIAAQKLTPTVTTGALPASRKIHIPGELHPDIRVPMREIALHPTSGEPPVTVYDASGVPAPVRVIALWFAVGLPIAWLAIGLHLLVAVVFAYLAYLSMGVIGITRAQVFPITGHRIPKRRRRRA